MDPWLNTAEVQSRFLSISFWPQQQIGFGRKGSLLLCCLVILNFRKQPSLSGLYPLISQKVSTTSAELRTEWLNSDWDNESDSGRERWWKPLLQESERIMVCKELLLNKPRAKGDSLLWREIKQRFFFSPGLFWSTATWQKQSEGLFGTCQNARLCWPPVMEKEVFFNQTNQLHIAAGLPHNTMQS